MDLKKPAEDIEDESGVWIGADTVKAMVEAYWLAWRNIRTIKPPPEPEEDECFAWPTLHAET